MWNQLLSYVVAELLWHPRPLGKPGGWVLVVSHGRPLQQLAKVVGDLDTILASPPTQPRPYALRNWTLNCRCNYTSQRPSLICFSHNRLCSCHACKSCPAAHPNDPNPLDSTTQPPIVNATRSLAGESQTWCPMQVDDWMDGHPVGCVESSPTFCALTGHVQGQACNCKTVEPYQDPIALSPCLCARRLRHAASHPRHASNKCP